MAVLLERESAEADAVAAADELAPLAPDRASRGERIALAVAVAGLLIVAIAMRVVALDRLPGVNGDEAWMGVQAQSWLRGDAVAWRTPTGNPLNPFAFVPLVASHALWAPSIAHLRWVAVASGLAALGLNYFLARRCFGRRTALVATTILAVLPVNIAYSRFGWDASQTLLFTLPVLYLPLWALVDRMRAQRWLVLATTCWGASLLVHPTNVFVAPLIALPAAVIYRAPLITAMSQASHWRLTGLATSSLAGLVLLGWLGRNYWSAAAARAVSIAELGAFLRLVAELFSGVTIYRFIGGALLAPRTLIPGVDELLLWNLMTLTALGVVGYGLWRAVTASQARASLDRALLAAASATLVGFYLVAGPAAVRPHYERYAQCLVAAGALVVARGMVWYLRQPRWRRPAAWMLVACATLSLAATSWYDFVALSRATSEPHPAFRTGSIDPKQAALALAVEQLGSGPITIGAHDWWTYWAVRYLAGSHGNVQVHRHPATAPDCWIELAGGDAHRQLQAQRLALRETLINDAARRPVVVVLWTDGAGDGR